MKKLITLLLSATLLTPYAFAESDSVVATYKGGEVKESQIMEQFKMIFQAQPSLKDKKFGDLERSMQENLVRGYISTKLLEEEVKKSGIEDTKEFQDKVANIVKQLSQQEFVESKIKAALTDSMIDDEYAKMKKEMTGQEEVKASHILVDTEEKAKAAKKKLSKGAKFAEVVKEFSKDEGTKANGGALGYFTKGQLVPEFEQKAFAMKVGEISDPVKTQFGWHIIKVEDKRPVKIPSKEEAKPSLAKKLGGEILNKYVTELNDKADIKLTLPQEAVQKPAEEAKK
jgi:peptidylprolyl isomerase